MSAERGAVAVVVPTINRLDDLRRCLAAARAQTRAPELLVVVDNGSSDGTREELRGTDDLTAVLAPENLGAPGGFQAGMRAAFDAGADWVWLLDDDAVPAADALERLLGRVADEDSAPSVAGAAPTVEFGDGRRETGWLWGRRAERGYGQSPNRPDAAGGPAPEVDWAPFAGLLLARDACEQAGAVRADYVLWHADVEYCLRLRGAGWRLLAAPAAVVWHPAMPLISRRVLGRRVTVGRIAPWREYYDTRNRALLHRQLRGTGLTAGAPPAIRLKDELLRDAAVLLADPRGARRVWMRLLGAIDGMRANTSRRPELEHS